MPSKSVGGRKPAGGFDSRPPPLLKWPLTSGVGPWRVRGGRGKGSARVSEIASTTQVFRWTPQPSRQDLSFPQTIRSMIAQPMSRSGRDVNTRTLCRVAEAGPVAGSAPSAWAVDPTRSTNRIDTNLRSSRGAAAARSVPHDGQNRASSGVSAPHRGQVMGHGSDVEPRSASHQRRNHLTACRTPTGRCRDRGRRRSPCRAPGRARRRRSRRPRRAGVRPARRASCGRRRRTRGGRCLSDAR